jgi:glycosyltransferase involved in cell wall biosynthesis
MNLVVVSHKECWRSASSPTGYATDGGFPFQMRALAELFDSTTLVLPSLADARKGAISIEGPGVTVVPLSVPFGKDLWRKLLLPWWLCRNFPRLFRHIRRADAVHAPLPGDVGTIAMLLATILRKPLYVRHCGNWFVPDTIADRFTKWFMQRFAGGRNVMLATGGAPHPPSATSPDMRWIFATTLTAQELSNHNDRERPPKEPSRARLIIACRQEDGKGTREVIQSLPLVLTAFPQATLDIVGGGTAVPELKSLTKRLGVDDRVTFHGHVDHQSVIDLLEQADLFCYPTAAPEGFPKVVLEALACGLPVVTTPVSVLAHLVGADIGLLLRSREPEAIAAAVRTCLADESRYRAMSARAIEKAREYSLERWRDTIGDFLRAAWGPLRSDA